MSRRMPQHGSILVILEYLANKSQVPAHAELMWILSTVASMGYLSRMTQWKVSLIRVARSI
jgi:tryptophanyl-tRNA synthetase